MLPNSVNSYLHSWGEYLVPVLKDSKFRETGAITPQEFLQAGDYLVFKSPYWHWESGDLEKRKDYLDEDKQFLVTRNVACLRRVKGESEGVVTSQNGNETEAEAEDDDDYMKIIISNSLKEEGDYEKEYDEIPEIHSASESPQKDKEEVKEDEEESKEDEESIPDIDDFSGLNIKEETDHVVSTSKKDNDDETTFNNNNNILTDNVRTYDLFITYDKYYQCPRLWLFGYDANKKRPLSIEEVFEDVSEDHAKKTITLEPFPHYAATTTTTTASAANTEMLTVHPCRHANVMKRIIDRMAEQDNDSTSVEACLIVFLKFMSCIVPTIEYDHTSGVKAAGSGGGGSKK